MVGDAFGGVSVPWHLTTREAVREIDRVLAPGGLCAVNLLDYGPLAFARAEVATLADAFDHVALATETDTLTGGPKAGGNLVVIASDAPLDVAVDRRRPRRTRSGLARDHRRRTRRLDRRRSGADRRLRPGRPAADAIPEPLRELLSRPHSGRLSAGPPIRYGVSTPS